MKLYIVVTSNRPKTMLRHQVSCTPSLSPVPRNKPSKTKAFQASCNSNLPLTRMYEMYYSYHHSVYYMFIKFACHCLVSGSGKKDLQITAKKSWRSPKSSPRPQLTTHPSQVNIQSERKESQSKFRVHSIPEFCEPG